MHKQLFQSFEGFAPSCNTLCSDPNASVQVKTACDSGSLAYCSDKTNINSDACKSFYERALGSAKATATNPYTNPLYLATGKTNLDYLNAVSSAAKSKALDSINDNTISPLTDLINEYPTDKTDLSNKVVEVCIRGNFNGDGCSGKVAWVQNSIKNKSDAWLTELNTLNGSDVSKWMRTSNMIQILPKFSTQLSAIETLFIKKINLQMLSDTANIINIRNNTTANIKSAIDSFVTGYITSGKDKLDGSLAGSSLLYDPIIQSYLASLPATDPLKIAATDADTTNKSTCSTNPMLPLCVSYSNASPANAELILNNKKTYCLNSSSDNMGTSDCITFVNTDINKAITDQKLTANEVNTAYTQMLKYCISDKGKTDTANCKPYSSLSKSANWLAQKTANTVIKDSSNNITGISTVCGTSAGLELPLCNDVCRVYPELCEADATTKCAIPSYRYTDTFTNNFDDYEEQSNNCCDLWIFILILVFAIILVKFMWARKCKNKGTILMVLPFSTKTQS